MFYSNKHCNYFRKKKDGRIVSSGLVHATQPHPISTRKKREKEQEEEKEEMKEKVNHNRRIPIKRERNVPEESSGKTL